MNNTWRSSIWKSINLPRFWPVGSRFRFFASARTASPMLMTSKPFDFKPAAIVDFPAPGIPVRHTIIFDKFVQVSVI